MNQLDLRVAPALAFAVLLSACGGAAPADTSIDFLAERNLMFDCGQEVFETRGLEIDSLSEPRQTITSTWEADGARRTRVLFQVVVHPIMGPALRAALMEEGWIGETDPDPDAPTLVGSETDVDGWLSYAPDADTERWERAFIGEVQRCWESRRDAIYESDEAQDGD